MTPLAALPVPPATLTVRRARPDEFDTVMRLLDDGIRWLRGKGLDQWSGWQNWRTKMSPALARGDVWLFCDGSEIVGTVTIELDGDPDFWSFDELAEPAAYMSKFAVRRDHAGRELGVLLLDWVSDYAYRLGCRVVRLDAWKTNTALHDYYARRGWTYLRTSGNPRRQSGTLFQIPARPSHHTLIQEVPAMTTLETTSRAPGGPDAAGNTQPDHTHEGGLIVEYAHVGVRPALFLPYYRYRVRQIGGVWFLEASPSGDWWEIQCAVVEADFPLAPGATYLIAHHAGEPCEMTLVEQEIAQATVAVAA